MENNLGISKDCKAKIILVSLFDDTNLCNSRLSSIYKYSSGCNVKVITSDFNHSLKAYKSVQSSDVVEYLHVPFYKKNLSIKRLYSHLTFAFRLKKYLNHLKYKPTTIYCAMPASTAAYVCGKFCKKNDVYFVIDVVDLWPDSLLPVLKNKWLCLNVLLYSWKCITIQAYRLANVILGESKKYVEVAHGYNPSVPVFPLYLGIDKEMIQSLINESGVQLNKPSNEIWICYGGSLGTSYDFETLIKSVSSLNGRYEYKLLFIGDGVRRSLIEEQILQYDVNGQITGFTEYGDYLKYMSYCDIAINIFRVDTKVVHSYKFNDYVATNCFILNSLEGETADMVTQYEVGLNFDFEKNTLDKVLTKTLENWDMYEHWKSNNTRLIAEVLDKDIIYSQIVDILNNQ